MTKGRACLYSIVAQAEVKKGRGRARGRRKMDAISVLEWDIMLEIADEGSRTSHQEKKGLDRNRRRKSKGQQKL